MEFITFGCKVNQYETQLLKENFPYIDIMPENVCVINSCCVTNKVEKEVKTVIRKKLKEGKNVWLTGCFVNEEKIKLLFPSIKIFNKFEFCKKVRIIKSFNNHTRGFVKIEDGCENNCSYCIIPLVRGKVKSRDEEEIIDEIEKLTENGYKEIVLTGIDLGAYGKDNGKKITTLIEKISQVKDLKRIRLSSIEAVYINETLIDFLSSLDIFCPHFHIPLQSGSDKILRLMKRNYNLSQYLKKIEVIKEKIRNVTFTTDIIVGFPSEEEDDFKQTCKAIEEINFLKVHIFPFSPREGTKAYFMGNKVDYKVKKEREKVLSYSVKKEREKVMKKFLFSSLSVLFEKKEENLWTGYSENYIPFSVISDEDIKNEIVKVIGKEIRNDKIYGII
ncbi:MAG TPA: MiaB/RimO family radical SAM methylthiotransferase [Candidatus Ratteibacteria bacterium]|nr:MiaB/RimO family radical SAM methylthiotransferase [Candidatus Ratteibacteria bacterium]